MQLTFFGITYEVTSEKMTDEQILAVWECLRVSINSPLSKGFLTETTRLTERGVRLCIAAMGEAGIPVVTEPTGGYYVTTRDEDISRKIADFASRETHCRIRRQGLERFLRRNEREQIELGI